MFNRFQQRLIDHMDTNRLSFTFFVQVELLLKRCQINSDSCFKNNDDTKTFITNIQKKFFKKPDGDVKIPFLEESSCNEKLEQIRNELFFDYVLRKQIDTLEYIKTNCIQQIRKDYKEIIRAFAKQECPIRVEGNCGKGKLFLDMDVSKMSNNIILFSIFMIRLRLLLIFLKVPNLMIRLNSLFEQHYDVI